MRFNKGKGDAGTFILLKAIDFGGKPFVTNGLPAIGNSWRYAEDQYGVVIRMSPRQYPVVESFLRQAFGSPGFGPSDTVDGGKLGGYRLTPKGGGIQFGYDSNCTQVIILKPLVPKQSAEAQEKVK